MENRLTGRRCIICRKPIEQNSKTANTLVGQPDTVETRSTHAVCMESQSRLDDYK